MNDAERAVKAEKSRKSWVAQLRAAATQVADQAEAIVGDLSGNMELKVSIILKTATDEINFPRLTIVRDIIPFGAVKELIESYRHTDDAPGA